MNRKFTLMTAESGWEATTIGDDGVEFTVPVLMWATRTDPEIEILPIWLDVSGFICEPSESDDNCTWRFHHPIHNPRES